MIAKIKYTWRLMGASWDVLQKDKELLVFPLLSGIACLLVIASFALPLFASEGLLPTEGEPGGQQEVVLYGLLFLFYLANYFVITFFNTAIISCAVLRMQGGDPRVSEGARP